MMDMEVHEETAVQRLNLKHAARRAVSPDPRTGSDPCQVLNDQLPRPMWVADELILSL